MLPLDFKLNGCTIVLSSYRFVISQRLISLFCSFVVTIYFFAFMTHAHAKDKSEFAIRFGPKSLHVSDSGDPNEDNNLIALEHQRWTTATFVNSHDNRAWLIAYTFFYHEWFFTDKWYLNGGLPVGVAHGYDDDKVWNWNELTPIALIDLGVAYRFNSGWHTGIQLTFSPTKDGGVFIPELRIEMPF